MYFSYPALAFPNLPLVRHGRDVCRHSGHQTRQCVKHDKRVRSPLGSHSDIRRAARTRPLANMHGPATAARPTRPEQFPSESEGRRGRASRPAGRPLPAFSSPFCPPTVPSSTHTYTVHARQRAAGGLERVRARRQGGSAAAKPDGVPSDSHPPPLSLGDSGVKVAGPRAGGVEFRAGGTSE